jgi:glycosyltransferase involved in cell wall biosynthesis
VSARPGLVHVIDALGRGGAETLLVSLLPFVSERYDVTLVTMMPDFEFDPSVLDAVDYHCLGYAGMASLPRCALGLRRIIKRKRPRLVRSQLFLSSLVARAATPKAVPLVFSVHSPLGLDAYAKNRAALPLEKFTYRERHHLIGVSQDTLDDFDRHVGIKGPVHLLHNAVDDDYFIRSVERTGAGRPIKMVAIGNLKEAKNYPAMLDALIGLPSGQVSLDIFGDGPLRPALQAIIDQHGLPVRLMGKRSDIAQQLSDYDLFCLTSHYEGFGIAAAEAMAAGLPMLLSDLRVLREVSQGNALFFEAGSSKALAGLLRSIAFGQQDLAPLSRRGIEIARAQYRRDGYLRKLFGIYDRVATGRA